MSSWVSADRDKETRDMILQVSSRDAQGCDRGQGLFPYQLALSSATILALSSCLLVLFGDTILPSFFRNATAIASFSLLVNSLASFYCLGLYSANSLTYRAYSMLS